MKKSISIFQVAIVLGLFSPLAFLPAPARAALLDPPTPAGSAPVESRRLATQTLLLSGWSRERAEVVLASLTPSEIRSLISAPDLFRAGGQASGASESLMSNEAAAIVLTLLMLAVVIGAVEIGRN